MPFTRRFSIGFDQLLHRARQAVELPHNQRVAAACEFQCLAQGWSIRHRARQLLGENPPASRFGERVPLQGKILVNGRHPRVAEQHVFRRSVLAGSRRRNCSRNLPSGGASSFARRGRMSASRFLRLHEPPSQNTVDPRPYERLKSRMSFERSLSRFPQGSFRLAHASQKPSFSRGIRFERFSSSSHNRPMRWRPLCGRAGVPHSQTLGVDLP